MKETNSYRFNFFGSEMQRCIFQKESISHESGDTEVVFNNLLPQSNMQNAALSSAIGN
jgi:hypothetical protein